MQAAQTLDPTLRAEYKAICTKYAQAWGAAPEAEQKVWNEGAAKLKKLWEEDAAGMQAAYAAAWGECATDGLLNEAAWLTFMKKHDEMNAAKGANVMPHGEGILKEAYANLNKWTAGVDGVSLADFWWQ